MHTSIRKSEHGQNLVDYDPKHIFQGEYYYSKSVIVVRDDIRKE